MTVIRKSLFLCLFSLIIGQSLNASFLCFIPHHCGWNAEAKVAYFHPHSKRLKEVYSSNWVDYQFQLGKMLTQEVEVWATVDYIEKCGESTVVKENTRLQFVPIGIGFSYYFPLECSWNPYVGAGFIYSHLRIHNSSEIEKETITEWGCGSTFKLGVRKDISQCWSVDAFVDYITQNFRFSGRSDPDISRRDVKISGFRIGGGIRYNF